jgi:hypothetical protein
MRVYAHAVYKKERARDKTCPDKLKKKILDILEFIWYDKLNMRIELWIHPTLGKLQTVWIGGWVFIVHRYGKILNAHPEQFRDATNI